MISQYELKKIYIAELGIDPHLQMALRSEGKHKKALKEIKMIVEKYPERYDAERALAETIEKLISVPRQREYAGILLSEGFEQDILDGKAYDSLRSKFGVTEYDDATKERVSGKWRREYKEDPFSMLAGPQQSSSLPESTETY